MNVVITGASSGIGYETVKAFCEIDGNTIFPIARNQIKLNQLKEECFLINKNVVVIPIVFDLSFDDMGLLKEKINLHVNNIDILINNAGELIHKKFLDTTSSDLLKMFTTNFFSVYKLVQFFFPLLVESKISHIVNIGSMGGFQGSKKFSGLSGYSASKAALSNLTECLAEELSEFNIKVNCLALGAVQTEMLSKAFPEYIAPVSSVQMATFIKDFSVKNVGIMNGKVIPVAVSTP